MENKIIDLEIIEDLEQSGVSAISLVEVPAIERNWLAFKRQEFVNPSSGERQDDFIPRCIAKLVGDEGYETDQAAAICYSTWRETHNIEPNPCWEGYEPYGLKDDGTPNCIPVKSKAEKFESYADYPEGAKAAAKRALDWAEENGWGDCGTAIGKARANQLANGEAISEETIARMASFERHRQNSDTPYGEGCGKLMWDAWGGDAGIEWASKKLETIREEMSIDVSGLPPYVDEVPKKKEKMESVELDIYGYRTSDFHMCPGAVATFQHLMEMNPDEETIGMIRAAAVIADSVFDLEEEVIEEGVASLNDVKQALVLVEDFIDVMAEIDKAVGMEHNVDYMIGHVETIKSYLPVIETALSKMAKQFFASEDKKIIIGAAMIPDMVIPRVDEKTKERYAVKFSAETIAKIAEKFMRELRNSQTNVEHDPTKNANSYVKESWIVETEDDKANTKYGLDVPVGSWMVSMRVQDPTVWKQIKAGQLNGFSIEGAFMSREDYNQYRKDKELYDRVVKILKSI